MPLLKKQHTSSAKVFVRPLNTAFNLKSERLPKKPSEVHRAIFIELFFFFGKLCVAVGSPLFE